MPHAAAAGRETARLNDRVPSTATAAPTTPTASASSAPPPALLTAVSPQHAWSEQLKRAGAADNRGPISTSRQGKRGTSVSVLTTTGQPKHASPGPKVRESSVDRILSSSIKQHTFSHAPFRVPPSLEAARSPYEPPNGISDPVQIRRDVKDSMNFEEYASVIFNRYQIHSLWQVPKAARYRRCCPSSTPRLRICPLQGDDKVAAVGSGAAEAQQHNFSKCCA